MYNKRQSLRRHSWRDVAVSLSIASSLILGSTSVLANDMYDEVGLLLDAGYSANAIYRNEVSKGHTIYSIVDAASQSDPDREAEFRALADQMVSELPRSACAGNSYLPVHPWHEAVYNNLEPKTVEEVARLYFEDELQLVRLGEDGSHGQFPVAELRQLVSEQSLWYRILPVRNHPVPGSVFVSLYMDEQEVVVDGNLGAVQEAMDRGDELIPVVFHYYREGTVPAGRFAGELSAGEIIEAYAGDSVQVSQVPNWKSGDFHTSIDMEELEDIVSIPEKEDIDEELWAAIEADLKANGFLFPVTLLLAAGSDSSVHNSIERVSVARELGISSVPIVFFYQPSQDIELNEHCRRLVRDELVPLDLVAATQLAGRDGNPGGPPVEEPPPPVIPPPVIPPPVIPPPFIPKPPQSSP